MSNFFISIDAASPVEAFQKLQELAIASDGTDTNLEAILRCDFGKKVKSYEKFSEATLKNAENFASKHKISQNNVAYCIDMGFTAFYKVVPKAINTKTKVKQYMRYFITNNEGVIYQPIQNHMFEQIGEATKVMAEKFLSKNNYNVRLMEMVKAFPLNCSVDDQTVKKFERTYSAPRRTCPKLSAKEAAKGGCVERRHTFAFFGYVD